MILKSLAGAICVSCLALSAHATILTHDANDFTDTLTPPFGPLADPVGDFYIGAGADYTWGNVEGVFDDGDSFALCGINVAGDCDLVTDVDARVVAPGTTTQAFASYIMVEAGFAAAGSLTLTAYDIGMAIIGTALNGPPTGPNGRQTMTIDRGGVFDIAYYSISGGDSYGVNYVELDVDAAVIPVPAALPLLGGGLMALAAIRRRKPA